ncbi:MAG: hypothetical protein HZC25_04050 [Rhodospirillales bacterium]|nr:hypothetical protein [Rhodospirillales bacterium]
MGLFGKFGAPSKNADADTKPKGGSSEPRAMVSEPSHGQKSHVSPDLTHLASRLRAAIAKGGVAGTGSVYFFDLDKVRDNHGKNWASVAERVHALTDSVLKKHLEPTDLFARIDDTTYTIYLAAANQEQNQLRSALIAEELRRRLIGLGHDDSDLAIGSATLDIASGKVRKFDLQSAGAQMAGRQPRTVISIEPTEGAQIPQSNGSLVAVAPLLEKGKGPQGRPTTHVSPAKHPPRAKPTSPTLKQAPPNPNWGGQRTKRPAVDLANVPEEMLPMILGPQMQFRDKPVRTPKPIPAEVIEQAPFPAAAENLNFLYRPIWDVRKKAITVFLCLPVLRDRNGDLFIDEMIDASPDNHTSSTVRDLAAFEAALGELARVQAEGKTMVAATLLHYETLTHRAARAAFVAKMQDIDSAMLKLVAFELTGLPPGVPVSRLEEIVGLLRSRCRAVLLRTKLDAADFAIAANLHLHAVGVDCQAKDFPADSDFSALSRYAEAANRLGLRTFAHNLSSLAHTTGAIAAGLDYVDGDPVAALIDKPCDIQLYNSLNLFSPLLAGTASPIDTRIDPGASAPQEEE